MKRADVSFTFLDRVKEIELNIRDQRWQSALALALTLPDICGGIAFPEIVKRYRDGRVRLDKQNQPTRDVGSRYIRWFDTHASSFFKLSEKDDAPYICGERCWQLRCEYLHQNKGFSNEQDTVNIRFHLGVNCGSSVCQFSGKLAGQENDIRIDIEQFCLRMCLAARKYYAKEYKNKQFEMYNTPVLDFVQATKTMDDRPVLLVVMCKHELYGKGLVQALESDYDEVVLFDEYAKARKWLGKKKPSLWVVADDMTEATDQLWRSDNKTPIIFLSKDIKLESNMQNINEKILIMSMPLHLNELRKNISVLLDSRRKINGKYNKQI